MDYIPYGEEWIKEMSKLPKDAILRMFSKMGIEKNQEYQQLKNSKTQCTGDRDCEELKKEVERLKGLIETVYFNPEWQVNQDEYSDIQIKWQQFKTENEL